MGHCSRTLNRLTHYCISLGLDPDIICKNTRFILSLYIDNCRTAQARAEELQTELTASAGRLLSQSLACFADFAPERVQRETADRIDLIYQTSEIIDILDDAACNIGRYMRDGPTYYKILMGCYLQPPLRTDEDLMRSLAIGRSQYYDKKKEAVLAVGIWLWKAGIPALSYYIQLPDLCSIYM